jgi:single-strand DNA-binding protein
MSSVNKVTLLGNLGKDPEVRATNSGGKIVNLTVATSEKWKDKSTGERKEKAEWHKVVIFNDGLAGVAERYLRKGSKVYLEGALQTRKWTDKEGQERYSTEVVLTQYGGQLVLIDGAKSGNDGGDQGGYSEPARSNRPAPRDEIDDDIPF